MIKWFPAVYITTIFTSLVASLSPLSAAMSDSPHEQFVVPLPKPVVMLPGTLRGQSDGIALNAQSNDAMGPITAEQLPGGGMNGVPLPPPKRGSSSTPQSTDTLPEMALPKSEDLKFGAPVLVNPKTLDLPKGDAFVLPPIIGPTKDFSEPMDEEMEDSPHAASGASQTEQSTQKTVPKSGANSVEPGLPYPSSSTTELTAPKASQSDNVARMIDIDKSAPLHPLFPNGSPAGQQKLGSPDPSPLGTQDKSVSTGADNNAKNANNGKGLSPSAPEQLMINKDAPLPPANVPFPGTSKDLSKESASKNEIKQPINEAQLLPVLPPSTPPSQMSSRPSPSNDLYAIPRIDDRIDSKKKGQSGSNLPEAKSTGKQPSTLEQKADVNKYKTKSAARKTQNNKATKGHAEHNIREYYPDWHTGSESSKDDKSSPGQYIPSPRIYKNKYEDVNSGLQHPEYQSDYDDLVFAIIAEADNAALSAALSQGSGLESRNSNGDTPLIYAVKLGKIDCVRLLLARGANPKAKDAAGNTPAFIAGQKKDYSILRLINEFSEE